MKPRFIVLLGVCLLTIAAIVWSQSGSDSQTGVRPYSGTACSYHGVPDSLCTRCHPELAAGFKQRGDWCAEHSLPESQCYLCNPELKPPSSTASTPSHDEHEGSHTESAPNIDWCEEHRVPESQCTRCHPELVESFKARHDWCGGHDIPESHCYLCNPGIKFPQETEYKTWKQSQSTGGRPKTSLFRPNTKHCSTDDAVIQLASIETARRSGIELTSVSSYYEAESIEAPAEIEFAATASLLVTSRASGTLIRWLRDPGEWLDKGDVIAHLESAQAASEKAEFLAARATLNAAQAERHRKMELSSAGMVSARELQDAEVAHQSARSGLQQAAATLKALGFTTHELDEMDDGDAESLILPVRAREAGTLVEYRAELGDIIETGKPVALIAQTGELWAVASVRECDLGRIRLGQSARLSADGNALQRAQGIVTWISDAVDPKTRAGTVRITLPRGDSQLRAHQFVQAIVQANSPSGEVEIPESAVQWDGCCNIVFVSETPDRFRPRKVSIEFSSRAGYVVKGLSDGETIVARGSYLLKTELMKGSIGAGCCGTGA